MIKPPDFDDWLSHGWGIKVNTARQLLSLISHIALLEKTRTYAWRGQSDAKYVFNSSLYRKLAATDAEVTEQRMREEEARILEQARRWGLGRDLGSSATDLHLLAMLQHHGVPTRLIDVTSNPMTALWFAVEERSATENGASPKCPGVLFAVDVTGTNWFETPRHAEGLSPKYQSSPLGAAYSLALEASSSEPGMFSAMFRVYSALPDERMKAQEGYFLGSSVPKKYKAPGVLGLNPLGPKTPPGDGKLEQLMKTIRSPGRPVNLPFCAIVIPPSVKDKLRGPLKHTYNRRRRVLFPDVDGFREAYLREQFD